MHYKNIFIYKYWQLNNANIELLNAHVECFFGDFMRRISKSFPALTTFALLTATFFTAGLSSAQAQEVYVGAGAFGLQLGYAHAINPQLNVRADYMTLGSRSEISNESNTEYKSQLNWNRKALLADWFPSETSGFRVTGGATFNSIKVDLTAGGAGQKVDINGKSYVLGANDSLNIQVKFPQTTPYLGIGWGLKPGIKGWGFHTDLGVSFGRFRVTETRQGELANGGKLGVQQSDVDKELTEVRDSVAKLKVLPQLTIGGSYSF